MPDAGLVILLARVAAGGGDLEGGMLVVDGAAAAADSEEMRAAGEVARIKIAVTPERKTREKRKMGLAATRPRLLVGVAVRKRRQGSV